MSSINFPTLKINFPSPRKIILWGVAFFGASVFFLWFIPFIENWARKQWENPPWGLLIGFVLAFLVFLGGVAGAVALYLRERPSPAQRELIKQRNAFIKAEKRRRKDIKRMALRIRPQVVNSLAVSGFRYVYRTQGAVKISRKVSLGHIVCTDDAIYYRITKRPQNTQLTDFIDPKVSEDLALELGREVEVLTTPDLGVWVMVGLISGVGAIPRMFHWQHDINPINAMGMLPKSRSLALSLGITKGRKLAYLDFSSSDTPHLLVAGTTGGGKSVFLNQLICTLITRNNPNYVKILLIDLKGGLEFWPYQNIPHLLHEPVIEVDKVAEALQNVIKEKERRFGMFRDASVRDITGWNYTNKNNRLPHLFVIFDEIQNLMLQSKFRKAVEGLVADLAAQGRALGIHLVLCTQYPNRDVVTSIIKSNIPTRLVTRTDEQGSNITLGNWDASKLPAVHGRAIYRNGNMQFAVQCPFISQDDIDQTIASLTNEPEGVEVSEELMLFELAVNNFQLDCNTEALWKGCNQSIGRDRIGAYLKKMEYDGTPDTIISIPSGDFVLMPSVVTPEGSKPRHLVPVDQLETDPYSVELPTPESDTKINLVELSPEAEPDNGNPTTGDFDELSPTAITAESETGDNQHETIN